MYLISPSITIHSIGFSETVLIPFSVRMKLTLKTGIKNLPPASTASAGHAPSIILINTYQHHKSHDKLQNPEMNSLKVLLLRSRRKVKTGFRGVTLKLSSRTPFTPSPEKSGLTIISTFLNPAVNAEMVQR